MNLENQVRTETVSMPSIIARILDARAFDLLARVLLTLVFWSSGLAKLFDFSGNVAIMEGFGLSPAWLVNTATLILQIGASLTPPANEDIRAQLERIVGSPEVAEWPSPP